MNSNTAAGSVRRRPKKHQPHHGEAVQVGPYTLLAGGTQYFSPDDFDQADVLIPLTDLRWLELALGQSEQFDINGRTVEVLSAVLPDFGGVPPNWKQFLEQQVIPVLADANEADKNVLAFCIGSHGRTGTLIASLIALLEPEVRDPIAAARQRHCHHAVETRAQAEAVFALRGRKLPKRWQEKFHF